MWAYFRHKFLTKTCLHSRLWTQFGIILSKKRPQTASIIYPFHSFHWTDARWQVYKRKSSSYHRPMNIYELHLATWRRPSPEQFYSYRQLADKIVAYVSQLGYTHIELMPLAEHPLDRSWGYQVTGFYSITSRFGTPEDFMYFVNRCHELYIGVIMDWVPGHFCKDDHGLRQFDGTRLYEYEDDRKAEKPLWGTLSLVSVYRIKKTRNFLILERNWEDEYSICGIGRGTVRKNGGTR